MTLKMPLRTYYSIKKHNSSSFNKKSVKCNKTETKKVAILSETNPQKTCKIFVTIFEIWNFENLKVSTCHVWTHQKRSNFGFF